MKNNKQLTAKEVASILQCSRGQIERLQLKGHLKPIETANPFYMFSASEVYEYKASINKLK